MRARSNVLVDFPSCTNEAVQRLIMTYARPKHIPAKKIFVEPGDIVDSIYYLHTGRTRHYMVNADGVEKISYILNSGWFLREGTFVRQTPYIHAERYSITETAALIYIIDRPCYEKLLNYPEFSNELLHSSTAKNDLLRRELESIVFDTAKNRLINLLAASARRGETVDGHWHELGISYSHQDIAAILGVNRVTISRLVAAAVRNGNVRTVNSRIQIDARVLASLADDDDPEFD